MDKLLSVVTPFYNESTGIDSYFEHLLPVLEGLECKYEVVCVDDGSHDNTFSKLQAWHNKNNRLKIIKLSRNFGKEAALTAGIDHCRGDAVILIDADLQDDPALFPQMIAEWESGFDVVLMKRGSRDESRAKRLSAFLFYRTINWLSHGGVPENVGDFRLMDRKVADVIRQLNERNRFMKGLLSWPGFTTTTIVYDRPNRTIGTPKQRVGNLFRLAFTGIFAFSSFPLRIWTFIGLSVTTLTFIFALYLAVKKLIYNVAPPGYLSIMVTVIFFNGLLMTNLGIIGEYVGRISDEVKMRPIYVVDQVLEDGKDEK